MLNREKYLSFIHDDSRLIYMKKLLDKIEIVLRDKTLSSTDFLDPYSISLAESILNRFDELNYRVLDTYPGCERAVIEIFPDFYYFEEEDFSVRPIKIKGVNHDTNHRDVLGSVLALGIERDKIGDILIYDDYCILIIKKELYDFVKYNLERIGRYKVELSSTEFKDIEEVNLEYEDIERNLSSLRLDSFLAAAYNISRKDSEKLIKSGRVRVNWQEVEKSSLEIKEKDLISTKGFGRAILYKTGGLTRKNRRRVTIRKLI